MPPILRHRTFWHETQTFLHTLFKISSEFVQRLFLQFCLFHTKQRFFSMQKTLISTVIALQLAPAWAETLAPIVVTKSAPLLSTSLPTAHLLTNSTLDTGTLLRQLNGVDGSRMGGHGIDPVIHGQKDGRVRIVLDGAEIASGCPNRMDPATVYADLDTYETVNLAPGIITLSEPVENAAAGTLSLVRKLPAKQGIHGLVSAVKSNLIDYGVSTDLSAVGEQGAIRLFGNRTKAQNYQDGNGDTVKASYNHNSYGLLAGWRPDANSLLSVSAERSRTEDARYPGAKMDSPYTEGNILRFRYSRSQVSSWLDTLAANLYRSTVDHLMDNYSFRPAVKKIRIPTDTSTTGASLKLTSTVGKTRWHYGIDHRRENKYAKSQRVIGTNTYVKSYMWPDTRITRTSLFAEATRTLGAHRLTAGLRYDLMDYDAHKVDTDPDGTGPAPTARQLYNTTYKITADTQQNEGNASLLLRWQRALGSWHLAVSASQTPRIPDATERYMAKFARDPLTQTDQSWVGNPNLKTEYHNQINISLQGHALKGYWQAHLWADWVNDYILKDWARNQPQAVHPVTAGWNDKRIIYINKNARLRGIDLSANWALGWATDLTFSSTYVQGYNDTDNRNLAGIPPLSGEIMLTHQPAAVLYGARINWAIDKDAVDPLNAPDENGKIPGWVTLDLYADWRLNAHWQISVGVDNAFDHAYANYLNRRTDPTQGTSYLVNEPGRSFYAKVSAKF